MAGLELAAAALLAAAAPASPRGLEPEDLHRLRPVGEAQITPESRRILFTVRNSEDSGSPRSEPWLFDLATKGRRPLTGLGRAASGFRWSPDGARLAYRCVMPEGSGICQAQGDGSDASFLAPVTDTNHPLPAVGESLAWSPDSRRIAFLSATAGPEGPSPGEADPVVITRYLYKPATGPGFNDNRRLHIFVADTATRTVRQHTDGPYHEHSLAWSPLGDEIAFASNREADPDRLFNDDLFALRLSDGEVRRLTDTRGPEYAPAWSPDGGRIAFLGTKRPLTSSETTMEDEHVTVMDASGQNRIEVGAAIDNRQGAPRWSADGRWLYFTVQERGDHRLYRLPAAGGPPSPLVPAPGQHGWVGSWSLARDGSLAFALTTPAGPASLHLLKDRTLVALTDPNPWLLAERGVAPVEAFTFKSFDGTEIEAFLTRPLALDASAKHPLIVVLHGGPHGQQGMAWNAKAQVYADRGFATLMVNYRGSTGYGQKLADLIFGDQDGGEAKDVLAAVDTALARYPWLDANRMGVEGGSYGGQLTNWLVTQTDRFRAAVSSAGIANLVSFNYLAYYHDYLAVEFGAFPHQNGLLDRLWERSPLRQVGRVKTPVLLLHGENDNDVPIAEAEQFFVALKDVGVETVLVRYPREGHGLRETGHLIDALKRSLDWYQQHFRPRDAAPSRPGTR